MTSYNPNAIFQLLVLAIFGDFQLLVLAIFGNFSSSTAIFQLLVLATFWRFSASGFSNVWEFFFVNRHFFSFWS
jgi:hypothetical protein